MTNDHWVNRKLSDYISFDYFGHSLIAVTGLLGNHNNVIVTIVSYQLDQFLPPLASNKQNCTCSNWNESQNNEFIETKHEILWGTFIEQLFGIYRSIRCESSTLSTDDWILEVPPVLRRKFLDFRGRHFTKPRENEEWIWIFRCDGNDRLRAIKPANVHARLRVSLLCFLLSNIPRVCHKFCSSRQTSISISIENCTFGERLKLTSFEVKEEIRNLPISTPSTRLRVMLTYRMSFLRDANSSSVTD